MIKEEREGEKKEKERNNEGKIKNFKTALG